jgi:hypothetical protein
MMNAKTLIFAALAVSLLVQLSAGSSVVTLTGGCPLYIINASRSYITFNVTNTGNGTASDLLISASFPGITTINATQVIPTVAPGGKYAKEFYLTHLIGQGSYAVNINATYVQAGSNYATVFPCIIYIGSLSGGPLIERVSVSGKRMYVNITNTAPQSIEAQVTAVVPPEFTVKNATKALTIAADGTASTYFDIVTPSFSDASFPVIGELSYEYNNNHYAQMANGALTFGAAVATTSGGGIGPVTWILIIIVVVVLALIVASLLMRIKRPKRDYAHLHKQENKPEGI